MNYEKIVVVTNRHICYEKHFNKDFGEAEYNYILGSFPVLRNISDGDRDKCLVLVWRLLELVRHNIPIVILREKDLPEKDYLLLAQTAIYICSLSSTKLILHNFYELACSLKHEHIHLPLHRLQKSYTQNNPTDNDNVYLGSCRLSTAGNLKIMKTVGASIHSTEDAVLAEELGATYITAGHIFDTDCKKGLPGRGLSFLEAVCNSVNIPVYAIGGINETNLDAVLSSGAIYGCMMSNLM